MALRRERIYNDVENEILTAMITSTPFMEKAVRWYRAEYFSDYARLIAGWAVEYYLNYREAPGKHIQNIYAIEREGIAPALASNVATYLDALSTQYEAREEFNIQYMLDTGEQFFRRRAYETLYHTGRELMMAGRVEDAIELHRDFRSVAKQTSAWENPFDPRTVREHFTYDDEEFVVLRFRGPLGHLIGPLERGWLVAFMAPPKGGKSFWAMETVFAAARHGKRAAYINLEMTTRTMKKREYKRLTAMPDETRAYVMPTFDCVRNQWGDCKLPEREGTGTIITGYKDNGEPIYRRYEGVTDPWVPCAVCRDMEGSDNGDFLFGVWYKTIEQNAITEEEVLKNARGFQLQYGDRIRHISYPAFSATVEDVRGDLEDLMYTEGFFPDVVVLDYADILASSGTQREERHRLNEIWKNLKRSAGELHNLWVTATQTNREGIEQFSISEKHAAEDIRKIANVDAVFGLSRWDPNMKAKEEYFTRVNVIAHRHRDPVKRHVAVLHQLELGLPYIDSEWYI